MKIIILLLFSASSLYANTIDYRFEKNLFQIEVQEHNPVIKHQYFFRNSDHMKIRLNSQLLTMSGEIRPRVGIPMELRISEANRSGFNLMLEQGRYLSESEPIIKSMMNWYYTTKITPLLEANYNVQADKLIYEESKMFSQFSIGLNYKLHKSCNLNMGTTLFQRAKTYLYQLGVTIFL